MSTHNICFPGEIRKILCEYPFLSGVMFNYNKHLTVMNSSGSFDRVAHLVEWPLLDQEFMGLIPIPKTF